MTVGRWIFNKYRNRFVTSMICVILNLYLSLSLFYDEFLFYVFMR